ncbi:MAG: amino acid--tRNA ligase-related protein [Candidatus Micrarchaeia archaeon]
MLEQLVETKNRFEVINSEEMACIDRINSTLYAGAVEYFIRNGFCWIEVPTLTKITGACENVSTLYAVDHFGVEAYLAQTGQLYLEAKIPLHKKLWTTIVSSRAEQEVDGRHLNQFTLLEFEHAGDFESLLFHIEELVKSM